MEVPYFPVEVDEFNRSQEYIQSLRGTLTKNNSGYDDEEITDQWLDEIIQSVLTDGQKATFKIYSETLSKKNRMARGDVRSLFIDVKQPSITLSNYHLDRQPHQNIISEQKLKSISLDYLDVPDYSDDENDNKFNQKKQLKASKTKENRKFHSSFSKLGLSHCDQVDNDRDLVGTAQVHFLGRNDLLILRTFAETEILTVFLQNGGIKYNRLQSKRKPKDVGVFGVPLQTLLDRDLKKYPKIRTPCFVSTIISLLECYVNEEGMLRVSGSVSRIKETVQILESNDHYLSVLQPLPPHDLCGLLKQFLRDLPNPMFTLDWLDAFCMALNVKDEGVKLHAYQTLLCLLPDVNRSTLQILLDLLNKICKNANNKMTLDNVSLVMGPTLFLVESSGRSSSSCNMELDSLGKFVGVTYFLLKNIDKIWTVHPLLLNQVRQINVEKEKKFIKKRSFDRKIKFPSKDIDLSSDKKKRSAEMKSKANGGLPENSVDKLFIHSCHPDFPSCYLKISNTTTAGDILQKLNKFKEPHFLSTSCFFESGGNIDHRLLNQSSIISAVINGNPFARFYFCRQSPYSLVLSWPPVFY